MADRIAYLERAGAHASAARDLLASGYQSLLRYACLELRLAIEALIYEALQRQLDDHPDDAMESWSAERVLAELLQVAPCDALPPAFGRAANDTHASQGVSLGEVDTEPRFTIRWADAAYTVLGNLLHEHTIPQCRDEPVSCMHGMRTNAEAYLDDVDSILRSKQTNGRGRALVNFNCVCGVEIVRRQSSLDAHPEVVCPSCHAVYRYVKEGAEPADEDGAGLIARP